MKWIKEDVEEAWIAWRNKDAGPSDEAIDRAMRRVMTRAVELAAARGGTMTEERVREYIKEGSDLGEHLATLGARIAVLEAAERATFRGGRDEGYTEGAEAMRAACLEAVQRVATIAGAHGLLPVFKAAIEGATP